MNVAIPIWLFWTLCGFIVILLGSCAFIWWYFWNKDRTDKVLFFDKNMRWHLLPYNLTGHDRLEAGTKTYFLNENLGFLNKKGKSLYIFHENNAQPMVIDKHSGKWLDPESLKGIINNKLVQLMLKPADEFKDTMLLLGAIGGMIAGISSAIILLIQTGVI